MPTAVTSAFKLNPESHLTFRGAEFTLISATAAAPPTATAAAAAAAASFACDATKLPDNFGYFFLSKASFKKVVCFSCCRYFCCNTCGQRRPKTARLIWQFLSHKSISFKMFEGEMLTPTQQATFIEMFRECFLQSDITSRILLEADDM